MAKVTDLSDLINLMSVTGSTSSAENLFFHKVAYTPSGAATSVIAGRPASLWTYVGQPSHGTTGDIASSGTVGSIPTNTTDGALKQRNAQSGKEKFLVSASATSHVAGTLILYDRLYHNHNLSGTVTTEQTVQGHPASPALTRYTDGEGNIAFAEIYVIVGTTARTITMNYTNQNGVTGQTSVATNFVATNFREVTRAILLPYASGDTGIRAVKSVTLAASTGTVGNFGITIGHPLAYLNIPSAGGCGWRDFTTGLPFYDNIHDNAHLAFLWIGNSTTAPDIFGTLTMVEK